MSCRKARELVPDTFNTGYLAMVLGRAGQLDEARTLLAQLRNEALRRDVPSIALAAAHMGLNQKEEVMAMLEKEVAEHGYNSVSFAVCQNSMNFVTTLDLSSYLGG